MDNKSKGIQIEAIKGHSFLRSFDLHVIESTEQSVKTSWLVKAAFRELMPGSTFSEYGMFIASLTARLVGATSHEQQLRPVQELEFVLTTSNFVSLTDPLYAEAKTLSRISDDRIKGVVYREDKSGAREGLAWFSVTLSPST